MNRSKNWTGANYEMGSGYGRQNGRQAKHSLLNRHCRQTQPADSPPGTGLKPTNGPQLAGLAANNNSCQ